LDEKSIFARGKITSRGKSPPESVHIVYQLRRKPNIVQSLADLRRPTSKPRRETRWNLLGVPKLTNRFQPLVGQRSPYC